MARQQCSPTLDQRGWKLQVVCGDRVRKIQDKNCIRWRHVGTTDNPADFGSRGGVAGDNKPVVASRYCDKSDQRQDEATVIREVLAVTIETNDGHDKLMQKWDLWTTIRVRSWVSRFIRNCRAKHQQRITGPITTQETSKHMKF